MGLFASGVLCGRFNCMRFSPSRKIPWNLKHCGWWGWMVEKKKNTAWKLATNSYSITVDKQVVIHHHTWDASAIRKHPHHFDWHNRLRILICVLLNPVNTRLSKKKKKENLSFEDFLLLQPQTLPLPQALLPVPSSDSNSSLLETSHTRSEGAVGGFLLED